MLQQVRAQEISVLDKPDHVSEASVVLDAPPSDVYELVTEYREWPQLLTDVESVEVEGGRRDAKVRFRSAALGHEVAVKFDNVENRRVQFHSVDAPPGARASGHYELEPVDRGRRTRLVATLYLDVGGVTGLLISDRSLRAKRQAKLRADLADVAARFT